MTKTVFAWSDGGSACEYYRLRVPLEHLVDRRLEAPINVSIGPNFQARQNPLSPSIPPHLPDVVIGQRVNRPEPGELWRMLAAGELGSRPRLVYELDDDLFNVPARNPVHAHFAKPETREVILRSMAMADVITVSTKYLASVVRRELDKFLPGVATPVVVIPNALPEIAYRHPRLKRRRGLLTVGWAGSSSHEEDFDEVAQPLGRYLRRTPGAEFHAIGHLFTHVARQIPSHQRRLTKWIRDMPSYYAALDSFDVGIAPLRPNLFNQSKSDIKFLEYAARGVPAVVTDCGPYSEHVRQWRAWPSHGHMWPDQIRGAAQWDRRQLEQAYEYARSRHVSSVADKWLEVIHGD